MKTKTFNIGKYQAVVSIRGNYNNQSCYPLVCVLTHIPTNTEKYVIEHKTVNGLCYQLHKYILEQYESGDGEGYNIPYSPMLVFLGIEDVRDYLEMSIFKAETKRYYKDIDEFADGWLLK